MSVFQIKPICRFGHSAVVATAANEFLCGQEPDLYYSFTQNSTPAGFLLKKILMSKGCLRKKGLRTIFGSKRDEVTKDLRKLLVL